METLNLQLEIFALTALGFFLGRKGTISKSTRKQLTSLVINVVLPCNIISSFEMKMSSSILKETGIALIISIFIQIFYYILNKFLYKRFDEDKQTCLKYATLCTNSSFIGLPIAGAMFGSIGLLYTSVALIPLRIVMWTSGISMFTTTTKKDVIKKVLTHPCIIAVEIGVILMLLQLKLPLFLGNTINSLSNCTTAFSMLIIGFILSDVDFKNVFDIATVYYSVIRLIVLPVLFFIILKLLHIDSMVTAIIVVIAAMPAGSSTAMLAQQYDGNVEFGSKLVFFSTFFSLFTIPALSLILLK